jgi:hypothetical protein
MAMAMAALALALLAHASSAAVLAATAAPASDTNADNSPEVGPPNVELLDSYNQALNIQVSHGTSVGGTVQYLATFTDSAGVEQCMQACLKHATRCWSFVFMKGSSPLQGQCFAVTSPGFNPSYDPHAVSGTVDWPCRSDEDCSLNGECSAAGACACRQAWKGRRCETLAILPATRGAGYRGTDGGANTSSWGGAVLKGGDGLYHMWAAEMTEHCGSASRSAAACLPVPALPCCRVHARTPCARSSTRLCLQLERLTDPYVSHGASSRSVGPKLSRDPRHQPDARRLLHTQGRHLGGACDRSFTSGPDLHLKHEQSIFIRLLSDYFSIAQTYGE